MLLSSLCVSLNAYSDAQTTIKPPPGFEVDEGPIETIIDLVHRGKKVASTSAIIEDDFITFTDPDGVSTLIPAVSDHAAIAARLRAPLRTHEDELCETDESKNCGWINADVAEIIYNADLFQAELFINDLYTYRIDERTRYLPPPTIAPGLINQFDIRASQNLDSNQFVGNARISSIAGYGRWSLRAETMLNQSAQTLQSAALHHVGKTTEFSAGLLPQSYDAGLIRSQRLAGIRWGTTLDTRLDKNTLSATPLAISLTSPAIVEIVRDGEVIDVQQLSAGATQLDMSRLPQGTYDVTLRIDEGGIVRESVQTYSTGRGLPPAGQSLWEFEIGAPIENGQYEGWIPDPKNTLFARADWKRRIAPGLGIGGQLLYADETGYAETTALWQRGSTEGEIRALASSRGDWGVQSRLGMRHKQWATSVNYREINRADDAIDQASELNSLLAKSYRQAGFQVSRTFGRGSASLRGYYRSSDDSENWFVTPSIDWALVEHKHLQLRATVQHEFGQFQDTSYVGLRLSVRPEPAKNGWTQSFDTLATARAVRYDIDTADTNDFIGEANWRAKKYLSKYSTAELSSSIRSEHEVGAKLGARFKTPHSRIGVDLWQNYQSRNAVFVDAATTLAISPRGMGVTAERNRAGVLYVSEGVGDYKIAEKMRGRSVKPFRVGTHQFSGYHAFGIHDVGLIPAEPIDVTYDQSTDRVVLYPGNIPIVKRSFAVIYITIGRLVDENTAPLGNHVIVDQNGEWIAQTDPDGYFQADIGNDAQLSVLRDNSVHCKLTNILPATLSSVDTFVELGDIPCRPDLRL